VVKSSDFTNLELKLNNDKIVAIATSHGYAGIGIVRISGHGLKDILASLSGKNNLSPRIAHYCNIYNSDDEIIDTGVLIYFNSPHSFTGEDIIEIQGHGSPIVLNMIVKRCIELGCRMALPGEFSQRAYLNGKIDLVQAESINDLIHAESEASSKSALKSLQGTFSRHVNEINEQLINLRMFVEATLDFPEEDIEFIAQAKIRDKLTVLQENILQLLRNTKQGVILNNGANVAIIGRPNVGKSSLMNALANEDVAIVTEIAGTTRDIVKEKIIVNGIALNIIDTAGIRETTDTVEQIGIKRAIGAMQNAQLCLIILDSNIGLTTADEQILHNLPEGTPRLYVHNKIDLIGSTVKRENIEGYAHIYLSAKMRLGLDLLRDAILNSIGFDQSNHDVFIARTRHLESMKKAVNHINFAFDNWHNLEILAEELRYAHNCLGEITGEFSADDLLGEIFSKFCIGK
jgi:tRNA modification GTPase